MIPKIYEDLVHLLTMKTESGVISWKESAYNNSLICDYDGLTFEVWNGFDDNIERNFISLAIKQGNSILDSFYCNMYESGFYEMERLKGAAQRSAHNVAPKISNLIDKLRNS